MDALERYVKQVTCWLPPTQRREVAQRLHEDLLELSEDATDAEDVARRLRQFGRPPAVAARYAECRHVIPGVLAPSYYVVLIVACLGLLMLNITFAIPRWLHGAGWLDGLFAAALKGLSTLPLAFSLVTLVFVGLGYWVQRDSAKRGSPSRSTERT